MQFREIVSGLPFIEGPVSTSDGALLVTDVQNGRILDIDRRTGHTTVLAQVDGGPNGAAIGPDGALYVCNNGGMAFAVGPRGFNAGAPGQVDPLTSATPSIQRVTRQGEVSTLYRDCEGVPFVRPNDLVFDAHGGFYFTDTGIARSRDADLGGLFYARADGSSVIELIHNPRPHLPLTQPNGVGLSPDGNTIYVAETSHCRLSSWRITSPGVLDPNSLNVAHGPGKGAMYDSLAVDAAGRVLVATLEAGVITVVAPGGELVESIPLPTMDPGVTNLCFDANDPTTCYVTSSGRGAVWELRGLPAGLPLTHA